MNSELIERIEANLPKGTPAGSTARQFYDADENPVTMLQLIKSEPEWAQARILHLETLLGDCKAALTQQEAEPVVAVCISSNGIKWEGGETDLSIIRRLGLEVGDKLYLSQLRPAELPQPVEICLDAGHRKLKAQTGEECSCPKYIRSPNCKRYEIRDSVTVQPVASVPQDKEKLAQWMLSRSIATGHGDTIDGLIKELDSQVVVKSVRQDVREFIYTKANSAAQFGDQQDVILVSDFEAFMAQRDEAKKLPQDAEQFANDVAEWSQTQFEDVIRVSHFREFMRQRDAGHARVPIDPTEAMIDAGVAMALQVSVHGQGGWSNYVRDLYKQMVAASQQEGV